MFLHGGNLAWNHVHKFCGKSTATFKFSSSLSLGLTIIKLASATTCSVKRYHSTYSGVKMARVAVIGGGAAGIAAARELSVEGHDLCVFEQGDSSGGVWVYDPNVEPFPGAESKETLVHSSMYYSLRTNLPRELMSFLDLPFTPEYMQKAMKQDGTENCNVTDKRRYPGHEAVLEYIQLYKQHNGLDSKIQYNTTVKSIEPIEDENTSDTSKRKWKVIVEHDGQSKEQIFDAVVVANGHYSRPYVPMIAGSDTFPGLQMHSHSYREPHSFTNKNVVVVGAGASGEDISRELSKVANSVYLCSRKFKDDFQLIDGYNNLFKAAGLMQLNEQRTATFTNNQQLTDVDVIMYCTGYDYKMPFFKESVVHVTGGKCIDNLWEHLLHVKYGASLSFIGLVWKIVPFQCFQLQSRLVAQALSGKITLPTLTPNEVDDPDEAHHLIVQWPYIYNIANYTNTTLPSWREAMYEQNKINKVKRPEQYRDIQDDKEEQENALSQFKTLF
eukprot:m.12733 g.12733  ORF g.12733 m.12733 type:complete len:499 (+) comp4725_c0_seq1:51-1547(+)